MKISSGLMLVLIIISTFTLTSNTQWIKSQTVIEVESPRDIQARLLWANLTAAQVNSSFPYSLRGSSSLTAKAEATFLSGAILAVQTGNESYLQEPEELCSWLNSTENKNLFFRYDTSLKSWVSPSYTNYAAMRLAELAVYANISHQWQPLLQGVTSSFIKCYIGKSKRIYASVDYEGNVTNPLAGTHDTSASIIALALSASVLRNESVQNSAYQLIMNYPLGLTKLPYHRVNQDGSPSLAYCKEDESFGLYVLAMEVYYYYFPNMEIKNRIKDVVQAGYYHMWNNVAKRWNYRTNADTGVTISSIAVHGFGFTDEAFLQAYLIWQNETWLDRMKLDMDTMVLNGAIIHNRIIAHSTLGQDNANEHWNVAARRTLLLFYSLNRTGFLNNSSYLTNAANLFDAANDGHQRALGWQVTIQHSDYSDYAPQNTGVHLSKWLQFVNRTDVTLNTQADLYRYFGAPHLGNIQRRIRSIWIVDDDGPADFERIGLAINNSKSGDRIHVRQGWYAEKVIIDKTVEIIGANPVNTIIDGNSSGPVVEIEASNVSISSFTIKNSGVSGIGVHLNGVQGCRIVGNHIINNDIGISAENSLNNKILGNNVTNCQTGIQLHYSQYNKIYGNLLIQNIEIGVDINESSNNKFYHNNFVDNEVQFDIQNSANNTWDNGYPSGGNYWSDFLGVDELSGVDQNEAGIDGISDNPYVLNSSLEDRYPFLSYWIPPEITILNVTNYGVPLMGEPTIGQGMTLPILIRVRNDRCYITAYNVSIYANSSRIGPFVIRLSPWEMRNLSLSWNLARTRAEYGNYSLWTEVEIDDDEISREVETNFVGWIMVTIPGDIDGNRFVDIYDIVILSQSYGTIVGEPDYFFNCDFDANGKIDIFDLVLAALNYGESW